MAGYEYDSSGHGVWKSDPVGIPGLPPYMQAVGAVAGIPVVESDLLGYDEMYISALEARVVVGEIAHFRYRMEQIERNDRCRKAARAHIEREASRFLGEPWKVA